jgi:CubicO group peptidase (beta-lactamase class C family)
MTTIDTARLQTRLEELIAEHKVPGAALGILHDGEVTELAAGVLNKNTGYEVTTDSLFQIGSITKVYTATVVMQLVDEGKLELDAPVRTYLPDFTVADADVAAKVTIRHLLTHTSGIQGDHFEDTGRGDDCLEKYLASCAELSQNHALGATMSYCNSGYSVLGRVLEVIEDKSWDQVMRDRLFAPLGLTLTNTLPEEAILHRVAVGHLTLEPGADPTVTPVWLLPRSAGPAGLINSTVAEVLAFARMHMDGDKAADGTQVLSDASVRAMQEPQVDVPDRYTLGDQWGLGWILFHWGGKSLYGHDGSTLGQNGYLRILPETGTAIALLTNGGTPHAVFQAIYSDVFEAVAGITVPAFPTAPETPLELDLTPYVGTFARLNVTCELAPNEDGNGLVATITMSGPLADLGGDPVQKATVTPVDNELFLIKMEKAEEPIPFVFYDFTDGIPQSIHFGARAMPRA